MDSFSGFIIFSAKGFLSIPPSFPPPSRRKKFVCRYTNCNKLYIYKAGYFFLLSLQKYHSLLISCLPLNWYMATLLKCILFLCVKIHFLHMFLHVTQKKTCFLYTLHNSPLKHTKVIVSSEDSHCSSYYKIPRLEKICIVLLSLLNIRNTFAVSRIAEL